MTPPDDEHPSRDAAVDPALIRALAEQLERLENGLESLNNRTNTLVHLLDILNKRVDRLESQR